MAQNVTIAGASYSAVPSVELTKTGGGVAVFYDASVATATADKILSGYTAFGSTGLLTGTASSGSEPKIGGFMNHTLASASYVTAGNAGGGSGNIVCGNDEALFSYSMGTFTCKKAGQYKIKYYARGGYTSSGATRYVHFQINAKGSVVASVTGNTIGNGGTSGEVTVTLAVGDEVFGRSKNNTGTNTHSFGFSIELC